MKTDDIALKDEIILRQLDQNAFIDGILYGIDGIQYRVVYWHEGVRRTEWVYRNEFFKRVVINGITYES